MGDSLYMDFWPWWLSDLAIKENAIIISPNYRLLPGSTSSEIYHDIDDFWSWVHSPSLTALLAAHSTPTSADISRVLSFGESAGGLLSLYLALAHPDEVRSCTAAYPWVDPCSEACVKPRTVMPFGVTIPESVVRETLDTVVPGTVESSVTDQGRLGFMLGVFTHGTIGGIYERGVEGLEREVRFPGVKIEQEGVRVPVGGIAIIHGRQDSVVPVRDVEKFIKRAKEVFGDEKIVFTVEEGEHGFDGDLRFEEVAWLQETFKVSIESWLA
jgi:acetyl esterase/lipase